MKTHLNEDNPHRPLGYEFLIAILLALAAIGLIALGIFYPLVEWLSAIGQSHVTMQEAH